MDNWPYWLAIMRTFVQLRHLMDSNEELARKVKNLEKKYDEQFQAVFHAIQRLIDEEERRKQKPPRSIGYRKG